MKCLIGKDEKINIMSLNKIKIHQVIQVVE